MQSIPLFGFGPALIPGQGIAADSPRVELLPDDYEEQPQAEPESGPMQGILGMYKQEQRLEQQERQPEHHQFPPRPGEAEARAQARPDAGASDMVDAAQAALETALAEDNAREENRMAASTTTVAATMQQGVVFEGPGPAGERPGLYTERSEASTYVPLLNEPGPSVRAINGANGADGADGVDGADGADAPADGLGHAQGQAQQEAEQPPAADDPELRDADVLRALGMAAMFGPGAGAGAEAGPSGTSGGLEGATGEQSEAEADPVRLPPRVKVSADFRMHGIPIDPIMTFIQSLTSASHLLEVQKILDRNKTPRSYHRVDTRWKGSPTTTTDGAPEEVDVLAVLAAQHALQEAQAGQDADADTADAAPVVRELRIDISTLHPSALYRLDEFRRRTLRLAPQEVGHLDYLRYKSLDAEWIAAEIEREGAEAEALEAERMAKVAGKKRGRPRKPGAGKVGGGQRAEGSRRRGQVGNELGPEDAQDAQNDEQTDKQDDKQQDEQDELALEAPHDADLVMLDDEALKIRPTRTRKSEPIPAQPSSSRRRQGPAPDPPMSSRSTRAHPASGTDSPSHSARDRRAAPTSVQSVSPSGVRKRHAAAAAPPPSDRTRKRGAASLVPDALPPSRRRRLASPDGSGCAGQSVNTAWMMQADGSAMGSSKPGSRKRLVEVVVDCPSTGRSQAKRATIDLTAKAGSEAKSGSATVDSAHNAKSGGPSKASVSEARANGAQPKAGPSRSIAPSKKVSSPPASSSVSARVAPALAQTTAGPQASASALALFSDVESEDGYHQYERESVDELAPSEDESRAPARAKASGKGKASVVERARSSSDASWSAIWGFL